jgi:amino acid adenylation domain-containing protein
VQVTVSASELLGDLEGRGVRLYLAEDKLRALAPRNVLTEELRQRISDSREALIELLRRRASQADLATAPPIRVAGRDGVLPLSFAQQRLWFLAQLDPDSVEYNMPMPVWWEGELDQVALNRALETLLERHEVLRTRLVEGPDGVACQVIDPPTRVELPVVDVSAEADPTAAAQALIAQDGAVPFDLATGPLIRARLIRVSEREHVLALCVHHVVFDEWSSGILRRELGELYDAYHTGRPPRLPELPVQYADFAVWQREWLTGEVLERQLGYWRDALAGAPVLELPTDRPRPPVRSSAGASVEFEVPERVVEGLRTVARAAGASMFMTLFSAFVVLLSRYSGQDDVVVGTPIANRNRTEIEGLIGFFVNTLVLRTDLSGDPTFAELLGRVREVALNAYAHQDVPFESVVDALGVRRDRSRTPLFQVMFSYAQGGGARADGDGPVGPVAPARPAPVEGRGGHAPKPVKFDLALAFGETGTGGLAGGLQYATSLFDAARIDRMVQHLLVLLEAVAANPHRRLSQLPLLTAAEVAELHRWSGVTAPVPAVGGVHELVSAQAAARPDAVALRSGGVWLSYGELEARANRLARYLRQVGVAREDLVGLCLPRGVDMVVAVLAVWKAGGAYVPMDPQYPADRLGYMLADSGARFLVATAETVRGLPAGAVPPEVRVLALDDAEVGAALAELPAEPLGLTVSPDQAAYVIYTSGSTGRPKGVLLQHRGVVNLAVAMRPVLQAAEGTVALQFASFSFDAAVLDMAVVLAAGGTLAIATAAEQAEPSALAAMISDHGVQTASVVPSLLAVLDPDQVPGVRNWVVGAERLTAGLARTWASRARLCNTYGPTEATVITTAVPLTVPDGDPEQDPLPPIGVPIANATVRVLDRSLRPVPVGVTGEIYIGGPGVARGYHRRPALTARHFVPDPVAGDGSRLYRSGDLGRWRADGQLEFVGRADNQVKVRGFRIEPGEIEHVLRTHPGISAAVVIADGEGEDRRLVAYLVPAGADGPPPVAELREFLRQRLPEFMVPAVFVPLDALPLGPNGKLDRAALPVADRARLGPVSVYEAPRDATEELLAGIWAELLKVERVGVHDNFFDLGGHSLLATQVMSRVRAVFDVEIPLAALFDHPTIAGLAKVVNRSLQEASGSQEGLEEFQL